MAKKLYLMSGHTSTGRLKDLDSRALADADNGNVLVMNVSQIGRQKTADKGEFFRTYFREIGAENVDLVERNTRDHVVREKFSRAGLVYLPGGDTKELLHTLISNDIVPHLESFQGVISGNSAGTYAMCPEYLRIGHWDDRIIPALGFVNFWAKTHYGPKFDEDLLKLSVGREIYGLEDESAIVFDDQLHFIGNIWRFSEGVKEGVN
ncbi:hypothetical protein CMI42_04470 [Candidatus Pacearchaeota archaeon]|nr:hypothetical protein [Candidatus Pacearchaeota archaeon]